MALKLEKIDLNLLVYLDVLLRERNVTRAASQLGLSQPAMSNSLRRLRALFGDDLLVRTSEGMISTERAREIQPKIREILAMVEATITPDVEFDAASSDRVFRILTSDYGEATLLPGLLNYLDRAAPKVVLDILTPSDMSMPDVEQGQVDLVINRFDALPLSFHQQVLWQDTFSCLFARGMFEGETITLDQYLDGRHVWVSKTGMGAGVGLTPEDTKRLGWVDESLKKAGHQRKLSIFTRHYQSAALIAAEPGVIVTIPTRVALLQEHNPNVVVCDPPFVIPPFEFKMAWSSLLKNNKAHRWLRQTVHAVAQQAQP